MRGICFDGSCIKSSSDDKKDYPKYLKDKIDRAKSVIIYNHNLKYGRIAQKI